MREEGRDRAMGNWAFGWWIWLLGGEFWRGNEGKEMREGRDGKGNGKTKKKKKRKRRGMRRRRRRGRGGDLEWIGKMRAWYGFVERGVMHLDDLRK
jgi:hypothetical protein